jgi:hypothetical protein
MRIVRNPAEPVSERRIDLTVYLSPRDRKTVLGYWTFEDQVGPRLVSFQEAKYGIPVEAAIEEAKVAAAQHGVDLIVVIDPEALSSDVWS